MEKKLVELLIISIIILLITGCSKEMSSEESMGTEDSALNNVSKEVMIEEGNELPDVNLKDDWVNCNISDEVADDSHENNMNVIVVFSEEELNRLDEVIKKYYASINRTIISYVQADPTSPFLMYYEGYNADEVVLFEVTVENSEINRMITIGSKDGWNNCNILNEGY